MDDLHKIHKGPPPPESDYFVSTTDGILVGWLTPVKVSEDDWDWLLGWVAAGFSEFLVGQKEHEEEYGRLRRISEALGIGGKA